ncbi:MAG: hypothetical protein EA390_00375 [Balneolaceae bacterium]|nr:MAG: hypothetical protein EA390_00375 [Balneolaceae bacterium]
MMRRTNTEGVEREKPRVEPVVKVEKHINPEAGFVPTLKSYRGVEGKTRRCAEVWNFLVKVGFIP